MDAHGDEAERLVREHYGDVLRYCRRHAPAGLAEDAAQETFLRFVRTLSRRRYRGRERAYLIAIARNACVDMARTRGAPWDELPESIAGGVEPGDGDDGRDLAAAISRLPRVQREALELRFGQELKVGEVAKVLGVSRFSAMRTLSSALEALKRELGEGFQETEG